MKIIVEFESQEEFNDFKEAPQKTYDKATLHNVVGMLADYGISKIPAIKILRTLTKWGLKESKDFVEKTIEYKQRQNW